MINKVYSESAKLNIYLLKEELEKDEILKDLLLTKKIVDTIDDILQASDKTFQINLYLRDLNQHINYKDPNNLNFNNMIVSSKLENPNLDTLTTIYPYEEGYDIINLNNGLHNTTSKEKSENLLSDFFKEKILPKMNYFNKINSKNMVVNIEEKYKSIVKKFEKHQIILNILEEYYSHTQNTTTKEIIPNDNEII